MSRHIIVSVAVAMLLVSAPVFAQDAMTVDDEELQKELEKLVEQKRQGGDGGEPMQLDSSNLPELQKLLESQLSKLDGKSGEDADAARARAVEIWKEIGDAHQSKEALEKAKEAYEKGLKLDGELPDSMSIGPELEAKLKAVLDKLGTGDGEAGGMVIDGGNGGGSKIIVIE